MRASCYTSTHIISCLDAPRRFEGTFETPGGFHLLHAPLTDTVTTTPFMWLPKNRLNHQCYTHTPTGCYYRCTVLCVSTLKMIQVSVCLNVLQRSPYRHLTALCRQLLWLMYSSTLNYLNEEEHFFQCWIISFPHAVSAAFSSPIVLICGFL